MRQAASRNSKLTTRRLSAICVIASITVNWMGLPVVFFLQQHLNVNARHLSVESSPLRHLNFIDDETQVVTRQYTPSILCMGAVAMRDFCETINVASAHRVCILSGDFQDARAQFHTWNATMTLNLQLGRLPLICLACWLPMTCPIVMSTTDSLFFIHSRLLNVHFPIFHEIEKQRHAPIPIAPGNKWISKR